jgi:hypothetical protein
MRTGGHAKFVILRVLENFSSGLHVDNLKDMDSRGKLFLCRILEHVK